MFTKNYCYSLLGLKGLKGVTGEMENCSYLWKNPGYAPCICPCPCPFPEPQQQIESYLHALNDLFLADLVTCMVRAHAIVLLLILMTHVFIKLLAGIYLLLVCVFV